VLRIRNPTCQPARRGIGLALLQDAGRIRRARAVMTTTDVDRRRVPTAPAGKDTATATARGVRVEIITTTARDSEAPLGVVALWTTTPRRGATTTRTVVTTLLRPIRTTAADPTSGLLREITPLARRDMPGRAILEITIDAPTRLRRLLSLAGRRSDQWK